MTKLRNPVILIGAFERHNFGDLLMGRVLARYLSEAGYSPIFASILPADLRHVGGSMVNSFADLAPALSAGTPVVHVGGETLPCSIPTALRMNQPPTLDRKLASELAKSSQPTGLDDRAFAYVTPPVETIRGRSYQWHNRYFFGLGGSSLAASCREEQLAVHSALSGAHFLTVRENTTLRALESMGLNHVSRSWDSGVLIPDLFGHAVRSEALTGDGSLLVHANSVFLEENLAVLALEIAKVASRFSSVRVSLTGTAANHDSAVLSAQLVAGLSSQGIPSEFSADVHAEAISRRIWQASCVLSTSLHFRIIALACGVPRVALANPKVSQWSTDCDPDYPHNCPAVGVSEQIMNAISSPEPPRRATADRARQEALQTIHALIDCIRKTAPESELELAEFPQAGVWFQPIGNEVSLVPTAWIDHLNQRLLEAQDSTKRAREELQAAKEKTRAAREELAKSKKWWRWSK